MLNLVEIGPGYLAGNDLGMVEIEPGYGVHGAGMGAAYPDYGPMYGAEGVTLVGADDVQLVGCGVGGCMGEYDDVQLVGADEFERPFYKRPTVYGVAAVLLATAATAYLLGKSMAYNQ